MERNARLLLLRDLREGVIDGELWLAHRYFLPDPWVRAPLSGKLVGGQTLDVVVPVADVGGAIEVTDTSAGAGVARLIDGAGAASETPLDQRQAAFTNLPAGLYRVELCPDIGCADPLRVWDEVEVERLATRELR